MKQSTLSTSYAPRKTHHHRRSGTDIASTTIDEEKETECAKEHKVVRRRLPLDVPPIHHRPTHAYNVLYRQRNGESQSCFPMMRRVNRNNGNPFIPKSELEIDFVDTESSQNTPLRRNHFIFGLAGHGT